MSNTLSNKGTLSRRPHIRATPTALFDIMLNHISRYKQLFSRCCIERLPSHFFNRTQNVILVLPAVAEVTYLRAPTSQSTPATTLTSSPSPIHRPGSVSPPLASLLSSRSKDPAVRKFWDVRLPTVSAHPVALMTVAIGRTTGQTSTPRSGWADPLLALRTGRAPPLSACAWTRG